MECTIYESIDDLGSARLAELAPVVHRADVAQHECSPVDFSYRLLRAM